MKARVIEAGVEFFERPFRKPLRISSGAITRITEARAEVRVRVDAREAVGRGSIYLSDVWAWPDPELSHEERDRALRGVCERIASDLDDLCGGEEAHPLELGMRLHHSVCGMGSGLPMLALAMCASPFDAAVHDGVGHALGVSAFDFYGEEQPIPSADGLFEDGRACAAVRRTIGVPRVRFDAWLIVSRDDSLSSDVGPWVTRRGYRAFKVKILGRDNADDAARTSEVYRAARAFGAPSPRLTVDSNEANPDAESVLDFLGRLRAADPEAFDALEYLEQPTARDIVAHPNDWRGVARLKPVLLDEGLTGPDVLEEAASQGWSGLALKTCKGHSFALVVAAWARERGMMISLQDLTNPGLAAIHAALFASRVHTVNGVELNSPQYTPAANTEWLPRLAGLLEPRDGTHRLPECIPVGLGSSL